MCTAVVDERDDPRSKFSNLRSWKEEAWKFRASTGFEPVTSAIPLQCSTNWAMKSNIGSEVTLVSSYLPVRSKVMWSVCEIISYVYCGGRLKEMILAVNFPTYAAGKKKPEKKNQGFNGIRTRDLRDTDAMLYQLSYETTHWERGHFSEFISSCEEWSDVKCIWNNIVLILQVVFAQNWLISGP